MYCTVLFSIVSYISDEFRDSGMGDVVGAYWRGGETLLEKLASNPCTALRATECMSVIFDLLVGLERIQQSSLFVKNRCDDYM